MKPISKVLENANLGAISSEPNSKSRREWALKQPTDKADRLFTEFASMWPTFPPQSWRPMVKENGIFLKAEIRWQGLIKDVPWEVVVRAVVRAYKKKPLYVPSFGEFEATLRSLTLPEPHKKLPKPKVEYKDVKPKIDELYKSISK